VGYSALIPGQNYLAYETMTMRVQLNGGSSSATVLRKPGPFPDEPMDRTDESLIALRRILRKTEQFGRALAQASGLTAAQFRVLQLVAETGETTAKQIAVRMGITQATVTSLVDKLVSHDLVTREKSEHDRRMIDIRITEAGRDVLDRAPDALQQRYVRRFEAMKDWEQAQIVASLERVAAMLDADDMDASPVLDIGDIHDRG